MTFSIVVNVDANGNPTGSTSFISNNNTISFRNLDMRVYKTLLDLLKSEQTGFIFMQDKIIFDNNGGEAEIFIGYDQTGQFIMCSKGYFNMSSPSVGGLAACPINLSVKVNTRELQSALKKFVPKAMQDEF